MNTKIKPVTVLATLSKQRKQNIHTFERGSAHVIVTGVLAVSLLGAFGFIFWQNFVSKNDVKQQNVAVTKPQENTGSTYAEPVDPNEGYLVVKE